MANKLELTWHGKEIPIHVEPRMLIEIKKLLRNSNGLGKSQRLQRMEIFVYPGRTN